MHTARLREANSERATRCIGAIRELGTRPSWAFRTRSSDGVAESWTMTTRKDPLHGVTLEMMLVSLVEAYGWEELGRFVPIRCFLFDPSIKSSLTFLRRTPWARDRVEDLYRKSVAVPAPKEP